MTADIRAELTAALSAHGYRPATHYGITAALLPVIERLCAQAAGKALNEHRQRLERVLGEMEEFDTRSQTLALVIEGLAEDADLRRHVASVVARARARAEAVDGGGSDSPKRRAYRRRPATVVDDGRQP